MPNEEKLARTIKEYASNDNIRVFGCSKDYLICGIIVLDVSSKECAVIKAIAVEEHYRKQGIGKVMIQHLINEVLVKIVAAETDDDAVGFYRNTGFVVEDLGEKYEGIKRYKCTLDCTKGIK